MIRSTQEPKTPWSPSERFGITRPMNEKKDKDVKIKSNWPEKKNEAWVLTRLL